MNLPKEFVEGLKTFLRYMVISVAPVLLAQINSADGIQWNVIITVSLSALIAAALKWASESDVDIPVVTPFMTMSKVNELKK